MSMVVPGAPIVVRRLQPRAVGVDRAGNLYVGDWGHRCIWKISQGHKVERVAGLNEYGYSGDRSWSLHSICSSFWDAAVDANGNLYLVDVGNKCVRRVSKVGTMTTVVVDEIRRFGER